MAVVPIKFRCYACNQLLGVSRSKIGGVVACPKCAAELVVPDPDEIVPAQEHDEEEPAESGRSASVAPSKFLPPDPDPEPDRAIGAMDTGVALDFLDIRPEDIRVEPGIRSEALDYRPATVVMPPTERPEPPQVAPTFLAPRLDRADPAFEPSPIVPTPTQVAVELPFIAPIDVEPPAPRKPHREPAPLRSRNLIVPRSVVASWSLFVLLALVAAFFAGLFAGHYVWRVH